VREKKKVGWCVEAGRETSLLTQLYDLGGHGVANPTYQSEDSPEIKC